MPNLSHLKIPHLPPLLTYAIGLIPAIITFYVAVYDPSYADPIKELRNTLGIWAIRLLIAALIITPLRKLLGLNLIKYRRQLGLLAFIYASLHLLTYVALDKAFALQPILNDVFKRPYILVGVISFIILVPLAFTSNNAAIRRLGAKWSSLHKWAYVATILGAAHFIMIKKTWALEPLVYAAIIAALLLLRLIPNKKRAP